MTAPAPRNRLSAVASALLACCVLAPAASRAAAPAAVRAPRAVAVTPEAEASRVALEVLADGGNAVDAAVAAALALAVTHPVAGNLGGGGFLLYRDAEGAAWALDFRETAPARLRPEMFLDEDGRPIPERSVRHGLAVGVPGSVAGLAEAHRRWGRLPWRRLVTPAAQLAAEGFRVPPWLAAQFARHLSSLNRDDETRAIFTRDGEPYEAGALLVQRDLARTLRTLARDGARGFYAGPVASAIESTVREAGGVLGREDLAAYRPRLREPLVGHYRGHRILTFPPPSGGGVPLLQMLGMLERFDLHAAGAGSSQSLHLVAESARRAYADRSRWLGDPDFADVRVAELLDPAYLARRGATIDPERATPSEQVLPGELPPAEPEDTLHLSVADESGGTVALTTTLNLAFGCGLVAHGTGVLLNNEIDDFALAPGQPNTWDLLGSEANAVGGGKRPLSSMTPTIVERSDGSARPALVLGSPGGARIITSVLQVLLNVLDHGMPLQEAVNAPRIHHQWLPDRLVYEERGLPADVAAGLTRRGHRLEVSADPLGNVNAIATDADGTWLGAADPRRGGLAAGR